MSHSHKHLAEALASFDPKLTLLSADTGPVPVTASLEESIEKLVGLMTAGKAVYAPQVLATGGEYQAHQIQIREQPIGEQAGKKLLEATIYLDSDSPQKPMDAAVIAHGIVALAANAAGVITRAKQEEEAAKKAAEAGAAREAGAPDSGAPTDPASSE